MAKVLSFRFQQCFGQFTMLLVEGSSETTLLRRLSDHVFRSPSVQKYMCYEGHPFFENFQKVQKKKKKNWEKVFRF